MRSTNIFSSNLANSYEIVKLAASLADLSDDNDYFKSIDIIADKCTKCSASDILRENRINFVIKYVADCCHFMVLDLEDDRSNFKNHSDLLLNLSIYSIKLYTRSNMDIFYIFVKTNVLQNILHEFNQIDTFYVNLHEYINQLQQLKNNQAKNIRDRVVLKELNKELLNLNKIDLTLIFNYYCCFDHSMEILGSKLTQLTEHMKLIQKRLIQINMAKHSNLTDLIEWQLSFEAIDLLKQLIHYSGIITLNNSSINQQEIEKREEQMREQFLRFYYQTSKLNVVYGNWLLTICVQFYFDVFFKYLKFDDESDATIIPFFLREKFFIFNMNICSYHFESYNSLFNTNPANLNQSLSMSHWPICVSFKQFSMVESFLRNTLKFHSQNFCLSDSILNELKIFLTFHYKNIDQIIRCRILKSYYIKTILDDFELNLGELLSLLKSELVLNDLVELQHIYMEATKLRLNFYTTSLL